jgi:hypothetical protein
VENRNSARPEALTVARMSAPCRLLRRFLAAELSPSALTLALVLHGRADDPTDPFVCYYDDLTVLLGARRSGAAGGSRRAVDKYAAELVTKGLVTRERKVNSLGRDDGPGTPYIWRLTAPDASDALEEPLWRPWADAMRAGAAYAPDVGPVAVAVYARLAAAADAGGALRVPLRELSALSRVDAKTAEKHLERLAGVGAVDQSIASARPRTLALRFLVAPALSAKRKGELVREICRAHDRTKEQRGKPYPLSPAEPTLNQATVEEVMQDLRTVSSEVAAALEAVIRAFALSGRVFSPERLRDEFVLPVRKEHMRRGNDDQLVPRKLRKIARSIANGERINSFAAYFAAVCAREPFFPPNLKNPRQLLARDENGRPFYLAQALSPEARRYEVAQLRKAGRKPGPFV